MEGPEKQISKVEARTIEMTQSEPQRENRLRGHAKPRTCKNEQCFGEERRKKTIMKKCWVVFFFVCF